MDASDVRAQGLGLAEEEVTFYDAVAENAETVYDISVMKRCTSERSACSELRIPSGARAMRCPEIRQ